MRPLRHELLSAGLVLSVPAAICLAFPFESVRFKAKAAPADCESSAAFVVLSPEEEAAALRAAKTSWQSDASAGQRMRIRLPLGELPEETASPILEVSTSPLRLRPGTPLGYALPAWNPSQRAEAPAPLPHADNVKPEQAFPREELLKLY